ncbi:hypothetical protein CfE428DRAFT_2475 [Chthoniobacter flavus Ellin428]|uniref:Peptidase A2 domain-containing protein n=1 Tax=Chthoniobacter flavus Ellin428 TaxID=497964 RepID=B4D0M4_9BACT|nr:hypothetical protein [Chthoniobacter flavus]EDY19886.1 hypothetical protein CfE428DRAFT_2475 [Chthoniobacter flavus Ellin428]TCO91843.1 hypothetical protein EV701_107124 [Chthoniobacter flavus]
MNFHRLLRHILAPFAALLLSSCATVAPPKPADALHPRRPPETAFDRGLGTDRVLCLRLQSERGDNWRFLVDTGSPITIFNSSVRRKLGPSLGIEPVQYAWSGAANLQIHDAPRLFLNNTLLLNGPHVWSDDLHRVWPGRGIDGILGLDCLRHYCVQLDFSTHTIRFLDPERATGPELGRPYPIQTVGSSIFIQADLLGNGPMLYQVDTGCTVDAVIPPQLFERAWKRQQPAWMRQFPSGEGRLVVEAGFPQGTFDGEMFHQLVVDAANHSFLGLRFFARHVVTLNFPKHTLYLRRI